MEIVTFASEPLWNLLFPLQAHLLPRLGLTSASCRQDHWESGKRMPDPMAMAEFYRLYGVTMEWIYAGDPKGLPFGIVQSVLKAAS
jgi:hypothetical protein